MRKMATRKKSKIGGLMGGLSEEREISFKTGTAILKALGDKGYKAIGIDAGRDIPGVLLKKKIDIAFIALHGRYGEDGCMQGLLEVMGIPYTGSGVKAAALAMDKEAAKFSGPVLIEKYIKGRELTVSILDGRVLPIIEIRPKEGFYDYTAKYTKGMT